MTDTPDCQKLKDERARLQTELKNLPVLPVDKIAELNRILGVLGDTLKSTQDDLEKFKKQAGDQFKELEQQAPSLAKTLKNLLAKGKRVIDAAGTAGETVSEFSQVLAKYLEVTKAAEDYYRKMEGSSSQQLDAFASYLDGLSSTLGSAPGSAGPVTVDPQAVNVMKQLMSGYADSVRAVAGKVDQLAKLQQEQAKALKEADQDLHRDILQRAKSEREQLADRKRDLEAQIKALDDLIEKVCPEPEPYDPCSDPENRVNKAVDQADADPEVAALLAKRSAALTAYRNALARADAAWGNYLTYSAYLNGDTPLDESTPDTVKPTVGLLLSGYYDRTNKAYGQRLRKRLDGYITDAENALKDYQAKQALIPAALANLQAATTAWENARNNAIAKIAAEQKWTDADLEVLRKCHPEVKEPPRHAMRVPTGIWGRTGALVGAGALVVAGVVTGVVVTTGGGGSNRTATGLAAGSTRVATGGSLGSQLRGFLTGPPSKDVGAYWDGYAVSARGCSSPVSFGPSQTTAYAGTIWMTDGVLHASGIEFSGSYSGTLSPDGAITMKTAPYPQQPESVDARITGYSNGVYPIAGTFSDVYVADCVITYTITSGHLDTVP
jgi:hypothetical protein